MIKLKYAIIGTLIPVFMIAHYSNKIIDNLWDEINVLKQNSYSECYEIQSFDVTVTTYNPTKYQTDSTPNELADGTKIKPWLATKYRYVALSRDLIARWGGPFEYGDYIIVEGCNGKYDGVWQIKDTMNPRITNTIDFLCSKGTKPFKFENVKIYKLEEEIIADNGF